MMRYLSLVIVLAAVCFSGSDYLINLAVVVGLYSLPALGLALLWGYTGQISLGHAAFYGLGAYGSALLSMRLGINPWLSIVIAMALVGIVCKGIGWLVFRLHGHLLAMATLGLGIIVHIGLVEMHWLTGGPNGLTSVPPLTLFGLELVTSTQILPVIWLACLVGLHCSDNLIRSGMGLSIRTVGESERAAASLGVNVPGIKQAILVLSGVFAAASGAIYAHYIGYLSPGPFDVGFSIKLLLMVAIGGFAQIWGVVFGVLFVTLLGELLKPLGSYDIVVFGILLVGVILYCPNGLLQRFRRAPFKKPLAVRGGQS